jgi:hypothetical protein
MMTLPVTEPPNPMLVEIIEHWGSRRFVPLTERFFDLPVIPMKQPDPSQQLHGERSREDFAPLFAMLERPLEAGVAREGYERVIAISIKGERRDARW